MDAASHRGTTHLYQIFRKSAVRGGRTEVKSPQGDCSVDRQSVSKNGTMQSEESSGHQLWMVERVAWSLVWLGVVTTGIDSWGSWIWWPGDAVLAPLIVLVGLVGGVFIWTPHHLQLKRVNLVGLVAALATVGFTQGVGIATRQYYSTDSATFNQLAAQALLNGKDPYAHTLTHVASLLHPVADYWTYMANGAHVQTVSYPAGSFLLEALVMKLGIHRLATDWLDLLAWLVTGALLYVVLPNFLRWLSPLLLLTGVFLGTFSNGGTDALFIPFLVLALWRWDRFGTGRAAGLANWIGPVSLGVACSIKQGPWFCVPFLVVGVMLESRRTSRSLTASALGYLSIVGAVFLVVNLPFIIWGPRSWLAGITLPFSQPLVANGQGLVSLAVHGLTGGVDITLLSFAATLALVALVTSFVLFYSKLKRLWIFLLPVVLFIPGRSLSTYLVDYFPAALVCVTSVAPIHDVSLSVRSRWKRSIAIGVPIVASLALIVVALTSAPLSLRVVGEKTSAIKSSQLRFFDSITVVVHNRTGHALSPHFLVDIGDGNVSGFWKVTVVRGVMPIRPGASSTLRLKPRSFTWVPARHTYWLVEAYTSSPTSLSTSRLILWKGPALF